MIYGPPVPLIVGALVGLLVGIAWPLHDRVVGRAQDQAAMVSGRVRATGDDPARALLTNGSELPVYMVVAWVVALGGTGPGTGEEWVARIRGPEDSPERRDAPLDESTPALYAILSPGSTRLELPPWARTGTGGRPAVELGFTDASGRHWIRRAAGRLESIEVPAWRHYGFASPTAV
jgi:hypothetical protein